MRALTSVFAFVLAAAAVVGLAIGPARAAPAPLPGWHLVRTGPDGGTVWIGRIPDQFAAWDHRLSAVYLPPGYTPTRRYPVVYLLHGMEGSPASFWDGMQIAAQTDQVIAAGAPPFIEVMPVAGPVRNPNSGEWAGIWESYVVDDVVPWTDAHLPTIPQRRFRALEGLCAGGYGAVDIGLRHPQLFGTLGSWEGYFAPVFRDGPFVDASRSDLRAHDPQMLVRREAALLRAGATRFYVSYDGNHADVLGHWSVQFAHELAALGLPYDLTRLPRSEKKHFWGDTVPSALRYAATAFAS